MSQRFTAPRVQYLLARTLLVGVVGIAANRPCDAATRSFTIDSQKSSMSVEGIFAGNALVPQAGPVAGDTTSLSGTLTIDLDNPLAPTTLQFMGGQITLGTTGNWLPDIGGGDIGTDEEGDSNPGDPAPGNYGLFLDAAPIALAWGSFRDLVFSFSGDSQAVTGGQVATGQTWNVDQGTWDTNIKSPVLGDSAGTDDVTGETSVNTATNGTYSVANNVATLNLPFELFFPGSVELTFSGVIVATSSTNGPLKGDFDQNGALEVADIQALSVAVRGGANPAAFDLNADGLVDPNDRSVWVHDLKKTWFGDSDLNGLFDSGDFVDVFQAGQYEDGVAGNSTWGTGDWNGDGDFDSGDFVDAFQDGGYEIGPRPAVAAVPEPSTWMLLVAAIAGAIGMGRRRNRS